MKAASIYLGLVAAMSASACLAELQDENILTKLPDGFKIDFQQRNKDMLISEMVPVKQSVKNWTEMVTVQVFYGLKATPDQFKARIESGLAAACPKAESHPVAQGQENGYPSMVWLQKLSAQQGHRQARDHLVQGDPGQRQLLHRPGGVQGLAIEGADHPVDGLPQGRDRLRR